jgi:hypothetical protein
VVSMGRDDASPLIELLYLRISCHILAIVFPGASSGNQQGTGSEFAGRSVGVSGRFCTRLVDWRFVRLALHPREAPFVPPFRYSSRDMKRSAVSCHYYFAHAHSM